NGLEKASAVILHFEEGSPEQFYDCLARILPVVEISVYVCFNCKGRPESENLRKLFFEELAKRKNFSQPVIDFRENRFSSLAADFGFDTVVEGIGSELNTFLENVLFWLSTQDATKVDARSIELFYKEWEEVVQGRLEEDPYCAVVEFEKRK
ncbi:MAG: hypothetical protein AAF357_08240, partial [Verrucomicrobiota bacterium]